MEDKVLKMDDGGVDEVRLADTDEEVDENDGIA